ncbi:MAG: TrkA C-terminal domain-containing protein [Pirellulaceae bacterium]|jgi:hypothetical protein|nr:TrkA C-terminal domain-containing protein [Pirellulaceae bacterium]MDP6556329.1 TrkA C-terminal domain-containing protein [Pirellulaceae bacterium]
MIPIIALLFTIALSLLVMRVGTLALMLTGVSREMARFQSRSAFTGVGYTTEESESITTHPVRRQIVMVLMLLGNIGIAAGVATMMVSLMSTTQSENRWWNIGLLTVGLLGLWLFSASRWLESRLNRLITFGLTNWSRLEVRDYVALLQLRDGYAVTELQVEAQDWLADKTLIELKLPTEGLLVLGIQCASGGYIGAPTASTRISVGDTIVLYGPIHRVEELDQRCQGRQGDAAHQEAVNKHEETLEEQEEMAVKDA